MTVVIPSNARVGALMVQGAGVEGWQALQSESGDNGKYLVSSGEGLPAWTTLPTYPTLDSLGIKISRKTADQNVNNTIVYADCTGLTFAVLANENYRINLLLRMTREALSAQNMNIQWAVPLNSYIYDLVHGTATDEVDGTTPVAYTPSNAGNITSIVKDFLYIGGDTAGNVKIQFAQAVAEALNHTIKMNSVIIATKIRG